MKFSCIVAADVEWGIGKDGSIPWHVPEDVKRFRAITVGNRSDGRQNAVIMGRRTWQSLPEKYRPLPHRINIVLSHKAFLQRKEGVFVATTFEQALSIAAAHAAQIFVIGGARVLSTALSDSRCQTLYLTVVPGTHGCDTFIPDPATKGFRRAEDRSGDDGVRYQQWERLQP